MNIFLSYASEDRDLAEQVYLALTGSGYKVFFDRESLPPGGDYHERIRSAVNRSDLFVFLISPDSVGTGSYALTELKYIQEKWRHPKDRVVPVLIRDTSWDSMPGYLKGVTILEPKGNIPAEVSAAIRANRKLSRIPVLLVILLVVGVGLGLEAFVNRSKLASFFTPVQKAEAEGLQKLRSEKMLEALRLNSQVDSEINALASAFENLFKGRVQIVDAERDKPIIDDIHKLVKEFDENAWTWFPQLVRELEAHQLLDQAGIAQAKELYQCYDKALFANGPMERYWLIFEGPATKPPPQQLSSLIQDVRANLGISSEAREWIVTALTKVLKNPGVRPIPESLCFTLAAVRSGEEAGREPVNRLPLDPKTPAVILTMELPTVDFPTYRASLRDERGQEIWQASVLKPYRRDSLVILLPSRMLSPGIYRLAVEGVKPGGQGGAIAAYPFRVVPSR